MQRVLIGLALLAAGTAILPALAQQQPRPPAPYTPTSEERSRLDAGKRALSDRLEALARSPRAVSPQEAADAAVFLRAAEMADTLRLYTGAAQVAAVLRGLETGRERCDLLARGEKPWTTRPGRTLRGFVSRVDGTVQPYGVILPAGFDPAARRSWRLDVVLHGRGPTEVSFLAQNEPAPGAPAARAPEQEFIELHPFGRGNNGWRWSGETDAFEALEQARSQYRVDPDRTILRGFSMGGHGAWHMGLHFPHLWAAVSPGAGFSETRRYLKITGEVPAYQEEAWHIYDAVDYALNLFNTPFITYGGEKDPQLQASLNMKEAAERAGVPLTLIVGPNTEHRYHPESLAEIMRQLATHRREPDPRRVKLVTWTLRYNRAAWITVDALGSHYRRARVEADAAGSTAAITTENVQALTLDPLPAGVTRVEIDGQPLPASGGSLRLARRGARWTPAGEARGLRKRHGLQGPIDDAFMHRFLVVRGTGTPWSPAAQEYADRTLRRFQEEWRLGFRGEVPVKEDRAVTEADWADQNLVLFGDPGSNSVLAKIAGKLPVRWTREGVRVGDRSFEPDTVPVLVFPNPLNARRYVVLNTGHTWGRREILASNAYLTPKLPDWAVLKPGAAEPEVLAADYFDEAWKLRPGR